MPTSWQHMPQYKFVCSCYLKTEGELLTNTLECFDCEWIVLDCEITYCFISPNNHHDKGAF